MHNPSVLILDEPTSGLDPIMQNKFVELIKSEKDKGKTIFMSSHIFEEVENTCDRVLMVKDGHLIADKGIQSIRGTNKSTTRLPLQPLNLQRHLHGFMLTVHLMEIIRYLFYWIALSMILCMN